MIDALGQAILIYFQPMMALVLFVSVIAGLVIGILPGIGGMVGLAIFLPLVLFMPPEYGLAFLVAMHAVVYQGASIPAILINVPGSGGAVATLLDGYPLQKKGEGARALGAALTSSLFGGAMPVFLALLMIPLVLAVITAFRAPELFFLILLGLSCIALLVGKSSTKGLISAGLGMMISLVGFQGATGDYRFVFGSTFLFDGLHTIPMILGLFGVTEMIDALLGGEAEKQGQRVRGGLREVLRGAADVWHHKWLWLRCTLIGYIIGIVPGVGGETAIWVAYAHAKQTAKNPDEFGTGRIEGVIAPESANNAKEAGSLLTTLALGIPGSMPAVILLGALFMVGITPGPRMLIDHLPLALTLLVGIALANVLGTVLAMLATPQLAKLASVHLDYIVPVTLALVYIGAFVPETAALDVFAALVFGVIGIGMKRLNYSRPAFVVAFVLGKTAELYLLRSVGIFGPTFFMSPLSLGIIALILLVGVYPYLSKYLSERTRVNRRIAYDTES